MTKRSRANLSILVALLLMAALFYSSSMSYQSQSMVGKIQRFLPNQPFASFLSQIRFVYAGKEISIPSIGYAQFIEFFIRKMTHAIVYFLMAYHFSRGLPLYTKKRTTAYLIALFVTVLYAITDEFHQAITPGRTPLYQDVILDTAGAVLGVLRGIFKNKSH